MARTVLPVGQNGLACRALVTCVAGQREQDIQAHALVVNRGVTLFPCPFFLLLSSRSSPMMST